MHRRAIISLHQQPQNHAHELYHQRKHVIANTDACAAERSEQHTNNTITTQKGCNVNENQNNAIIEAYVADRSQHHARNTTGHTTGM